MKRGCLQVAPPAARETKRLNLAKLRLLLLQQRAKGFTGTIDTCSRLGPGVCRADGSLVMLEFGARRDIPGRRRHQKVRKPMFPLLTSWQGIRLVLFRKPGRLRWIRVVRQD